VQYVSCLDLVYGRTAPAEGSVIEELFQRMSDMLKSVHVDYAIRLFGLHFRMMFEGLPQPIARFLFGRVLKELLAQTKGAEAWRLLFPAMPLIASISEWNLPLPELAELGDRAQDRIAGLHFKPKADGALWVIGLNLRQPVILTITCLDDRVDTFIAAAFLAVFFKGFEQGIAEMLSVPQIPRHELDICVANIESMPPDMRPYFPADITTCAVTRPTQPAQKGQYVPTFVVCGRDLGRQWRAGTGSGSAVQVLLGEVLIEVVYQLLEGELDLDVLRPKIVQIAPKTVSY